NGNLWAIQQGQATIRAKSGGAEAQITVDVVAADVLTIEVFPMAVTITAGDDYTDFKVRAYDATGQRREDIEQNVTWSINKESLATIDENSGDVSTIGAGEVTVQAEYAGVVGSATLT